MAIEAGRGVVKGFIAAEGADQEARRKPARKPGDGVDLRSREIAAERVTVEIGTALLRLAGSG
jgi:hypothetical protein